MGKAPVAQLDRAPASGAGCRRFESSRACLTVSPSCDDQRGGETTWKEHNLKLRVMLVALAVALGLLPVLEKSRAASELRVPAEIAADRDSLEAMIRYLSIDPSSGNPRSRYVFREDELGLLADSLSARLERYTGVTPTRQSFAIEWSFDDHDSTFTGENIICRVEAAGHSSGVLILTAHFDAIAHRSFPGGWSDAWMLAEAPGADDNATGVAAVMEAARLLSPLELPFDLEFILFSAEELGRLGSIHYVSLCDEDCADRHLGVINADMIGYSGNGTGASVMSDFRSGWLADMIIEYASETDPSLEVALIKPGPSNWDHASFWERENGRLPAISLAEPLAATGSITYPDYHTVDDLIENVDFDQTLRIASLINGFVASFSGAPAEISMLEADFLVLVNDAIRHENVFQAGEEISLRPRVRNTGGAQPPEGARVVLEVWLENAGGRKRLYSGELDPADPLRFSHVDIALGTGSGLGGENIVTAEIVVQGMDDDPSDNKASVFFVVEGTGTSIENHHFSPNPINHAFSDAKFCINTSEEVNLTLQLFSLEGDQLGSVRLGAGYGVPVPTGLSCHSCGDLFPGITELASGIYLYRMLVFGMDGRSADYHGRFAVER